MGKAFGWVWSSFIHLSVAGVGFYTYLAHVAPDEGPDLAARSSVARPLMMDLGRERVPVAFEQSQPPDQPTPVEPEEVTVEIEREAAEPIEVQESVRAERPEPCFNRPLRTVEALARPMPSEPVDGVETCDAVALHEAKAVYPPLARRRGLEGEVLLVVAILEDGRCGGAAVVESAGYSAFDESALAAVRNWLFRPATRAGQPVASSQRIRFVFRLQG